MIYYLALALMILVGSMFTGLVAAAWMRGAGDDETDDKGADEGAWRL